MSLKTWKREFYPLPASRVSKKRALEHTYRKWRGAQKSKLRKHNVCLAECEGFCCGIADGEKKFYFNRHSCALCFCYAETTARFCPKCPLVIVGGADACCLEDGSPYEHFKRTGDPKPMLRLLRKCMKVYGERK